MRTVGTAGRGQAHTAAHSGTATRGTATRGGRRGGGQPDRHRAGGAVPAGGLVDRDELELRRRPARPGGSARCYCKWLLQPGRGHALWCASPGTQSQVAPARIEHPGPAPGWCASLGGPGECGRWSRGTRCHAAGNVRPIHCRSRVPLPFTLTCNAESPVARPPETPPIREPSALPLRPSPNLTARTCTACKRCWSALSPPPSVSVLCLLFCLSPLAEHTD